MKENIEITPPVVSEEKAGAFTKVEDLGDHVQAEVGAGASMNFVLDKLGDLSREHGKPAKAIIHSGLGKELLTVSCERIQENN